MAALLALARATANAQPEHSVIFLATDAEEQGLHGAQAFVHAPAVELNAIIVNLNIDMIGHGGRRKALYLLNSGSGDRHAGIVNTFINKQVSETLRLYSGRRLQHRSANSGASKINWLKASDHARFHSAGVPFIYAGTLPRPHYHSPDDTANNIDRPFFETASQTLTSLLATFDNQMCDAASR